MLEMAKPVQVMLADSWIRGKLSLPPYWSKAMKTRNLIAALVVFTLISISARAQESLVTYKWLGTELALNLARAALADCQRRGYQVAVAVC